MGAMRSTHKAGVCAQRLGPLLLVRFDFRISFRRYYFFPKKIFFSRFVAGQLVVVRAEEKSVSVVPSLCWLI